MVQSGWVDPQALDQSRPGRLGFLDAQDPDDPTGERRRTVWVVKSDLAKKLKHQPWVAHNIATAFSVLQSPARIYQGTRKDDKGLWNGTCYVGCPEQYCNDSGDKLPLPPGRLYVVFIRDNADVHEWGKEPCDPEQPDVPRDEASDPRFEKQIWPILGE